MSTAAAASSVPRASVAAAPPAEVDDRADAPARDTRPDPGAEPGDEAAAKHGREGNARRRARPWKRNQRVGPPGIDGSKVPRGSGATVHRIPIDDVRSPLVGWAAAADAFDDVDRRRRPIAVEPPADWAGHLAVGETFKYDLHFAGNPAGNIEARVDALVPDPRGAPPRGAPMLRLQAKAVSAGVFGMLATVTDEMESLIDARTGASVSNSNHVTRGGLMAPYRDRRTQTDYEGRGYVRISDVKDDDAPKRKNSLVPEDTLDPLALMAWARFLDLEDGERAVVHTLDVRALLRVEVVGRGRKAPDDLPSLVTALGIAKTDISMIEGTLTRVDRHDQPIPDKRPFTFRAYISADGRGIPLVMETDIWVGVFRLSLAGYDPPSGGDHRVDPAPAADPASDG